MKKTRYMILAIIIASIMPVFGQVPTTTPSNLYTGPAVMGTVSVDYDSRKNLEPGTGKFQVNKTTPYKDTATINLRAGSVGFNGTLTRTPMIKAGMFGSVKQPGYVAFNVNTGIVLTPMPATFPSTITAYRLQDLKSYGMWAGVVPVNEQNKYTLNGVPDSQQRMAIKTVGNDTAFTDYFTGTLRGRTEKPAGFVWKPQAVWAKVKGKDMQIKVAKPDPMYFDSCMIAAGPRQTYPKTTVQGSFIYDRETGSYTPGPEGLRFTYIDPITHRELTDVVTGTLDYHSDAQKESNGKSIYEFSLRFNDNLPKTDDVVAANTAVSLDDTAAATTAGTNEHSLTGTIQFTDTLPYVKINGMEEPQPVHTDSTYALSATNLTRAQIVNTTKWLIMSFWPLNDE